MCCDGDSEDEMAATLLDLHVVVPERRREDLSANPTIPLVLNPAFLRDR
jgi:hypothetical protein